MNISYGDSMTEADLSVLIPSHQGTAQQFVHTINVHYLLIDVPIMWDQNGFEWQLKVDVQNSIEKASRRGIMIFL